MNFQIPNLEIHFHEKKKKSQFLGVAVRSNMDATITNQYSAVIARLSDQVST